MIVSPAQLETEAETAAERLLEEIDANQGLPPASFKRLSRVRTRRLRADADDGDNDTEEQGALESAVAAGVVARRRGGGGPRGARPGFALGAAEEASVEDDADSDDEEADEVDPDFDPDDDVAPASTSSDAA